MIFELIRSASEAAQAAVSRTARSLALEAQLLRDAIPQAEKHQVLVDIAAIKKQAKESLPPEKKPEDLGEKVRHASEVVGMLAATFLVARVLSELAEFVTTPSPAAAFMLTITPPPVTIALYALVGAVSLIKLGFEASQAFAMQAMISRTDDITLKTKYQEARNKALMNATQAILAIGVSALMIAGSYFAPGAINMAAGALLGTSLAIGGSRAFFGGYTAAVKKSPDLQHQQHHHHDKTPAHHEHTTNLSKAFFAYLSVRWQVRNVNNKLRRAGAVTARTEEIITNQIEAQPYNTPGPNGSDHSLKSNEIKGKNLEKNSLEKTARNAKDGINIEHKI